MRPLQLSLFCASPAARQTTSRPDPSKAQVNAAAESPRSAVLPWEPADRVHGLALAVRLTTLLREPVEVELTDNAWTMVSWRRRHGKLRFRLHHMFGRASDAVVRAIAGFTGRARRAAGRVIDEFIRQHRHLIKVREARPEPEQQPRGDVYDLLEIYQRLNRLH